MSKFSRMRALKHERARVVTQARREAEPRSRAAPGANVRAAVALGPARATGRRELERASRPGLVQPIGFAGFRCRVDGASGETPSRKEPERVVRRQLPMRSHCSLVANQRRGSVNRSPRGAIRGGFAVSPQNSERFARGACCGAALAPARREPSERDERRVGQLSRSLSCPVGREKPRGV